MFYLCSFDNNSLLAISLEIFSRPSANSPRLTSSSGYHFPFLSMNTSCNFLSTIVPPPQELIICHLNFSHKLFSFVYISLGDMRYGSACTKAYTRISLDAEHLSLKANIIITNGKEEDAL